MTFDLRLRAAFSGLVLALYGCGADPQPPRVNAGEDSGTDAGTLTPTDLGAETSVPPGPSGLPCDVGAVLQERCVSCHAATPRYGAPMPLVTLADLRAPAASEPRRAVHELVAARIRDDRQPMPPSPAARLGASAIDALVRWSAAGAPASSTTCNAPVDAGSDAATPPPLGCTPTRRFLAHAAGSDTTPYAVPVDASNLYQCFAFRSPFGAQEQATAWSPVIADERVVHHWILYRTRTPQTEGAVARCNMPADATFVVGWAPGGQAVSLPRDVGLKLRTAADEWLILQIHYYNPRGLTDARDASGVELCTTNTPRPIQAGVVTIGQPLFSIPARAVRHAVTGRCTNFLPQPITIVGSFPHMHQLGVSFRTLIQRAGMPVPTETLVSVDSWRFDDQAQHLHDPPVVLRSGDALVTTCEYTNPTTRAVTFGERTEDEMCFNFVTAYPIDAIPETSVRGCYL